MIGAVENTTAPETAKLCSQYLGPALRLLNFNNLPLPINPYLRPAPKPENIIYTDPKLAPGGAGPGDPPEPLPSVSAYTRRRRYPAAAGLGTRRRAPPGLYSPGGRGTRHSVAGVVPRRTDSGAAHCAPRTRRPTWTACCFRRRRRPPLRRCRPMHPCCQPKGCRHHDSPRAREEQVLRESCEERGHRGIVRCADGDWLCLPGPEFACRCPERSDGGPTPSPTTSRSRMSPRWSRIRR